MQPDYIPYELSLEEAKQRFGECTLYKLELRNRYTDEWSMRFFQNKTDAKAYAAMAVHAIDYKITIIKPTH